MSNVSFTVPPLIVMLPIVLVPVFFTVNCTGRSRPGVSSSRSVSVSTSMAAASNVPAPSFIDAMGVCCKIFSTSVSSPVDVSAVTG